MKNLSIQSLLPSLLRLLGKLRAYAGVLLFLLFACIYGYMVLQISALSSPPVDDNAVSEQVKASPAPNIDSQAVKQLETLKDNSVNVQSLFEGSRTNPFQE